MQTVASFRDYLHMMLLKYSFQASSTKRTKQLNIFRSGKRDEISSKYDENNLNINFVFFSLHTLLYNTSICYVQ